MEKFKIKDWKRLIIISALSMFMLISISGSAMAVENSTNSKANSGQSILVVSAEGEPIEGAEFNISNSEGNVVAKTVSDASGKADISSLGLSDGEYILTQTKTADGFKTIDPINNFTVKAVFDDPSKVQTKIVNQKISEEKGDLTSLEALGISPIEYRAHSQNIGWQDWVKNGELAGTTGQSLRLEAFEIKSNVDGVGLSYTAHVQNIGWQDNVSDGETAGTTGQSYRAEAIKISLTGDKASQYNVFYRVHVKDFGWLGWAENGESAGTEGYAMRIEGVEIKLLSKDTVFDKGDKKASKTSKATCEVHMENVGWKDAVVQNISGEPGGGKRIEAIKIYKSDDTANVKLSYSAHVQNIGWQNAVSEGEIAGTTGQSLRMESIKINVSGDDSYLYAVYYRAYVEGLGWLDWTRNGEQAGSAKISRKMEALEVKLLPLGSEGAPEVGDNAFVDHLSKVNPGDTGIDVSEWNGYSNNWAAAKQAGIKFAFLRAGWGRSGNGRADYAFNENYNGAKNAGVPVGVYHFSYANSVPEAAAEADLCLSILNGRHLDLPVAFDAEDSATLGNRSPGEVTDMIITFCDKIRAAGYQPMVYANLNWFTNKIDYGRLAQRGYKIWLAQYNSEPTFGNHFDVWQYSSRGVINGIGSPVDMNLAYSELGQ